jgi:CxxC motif-containing protein (DUF1111 family)
MGPDLADGFIMGAGKVPASVKTSPATVASGPATGGEWKTQQLWGLRFKSSYLHDGRAATLDEAIRLHREHPQAAPGRRSEATGVVLNYEALSLLDQDAIAQFLKTL